ncbi:LysR family transcriptional regulator [Rhizobium oryzicola]|uniref:LysR family transcriptional regulator n=1 Tax=Rhizobium oryzicola TaxID=1232668 RepID=A0ABT8T3L9_9HYPH|nr:LysR family transcriptional regulator [Rhizobium oryzicola]MDO1585296.1 LysR family transcriptional regulator [Rhizobium oryzicola]
METDDVRVFVTAASAGSLSAAARRLGLTPMTATRRLASLEAALNVRLMQRTTRSLSLTPEGEAFLPYAQAMVENSELALAHLHDGEGHASGLLRVSVPIAFGRKFVAPIVPALLEKNPKLRITLDMNDALPDLVATGMDLAIRIARLRDNQLIAQKLADNPRFLVASPDYLQRRGTPQTTQDIVNHDCLPLSNATHWTFQGESGERLARLNVRFSASSIEGCHAACLAGGGIALLSHWNIAEDIRLGRLVPIQLEDASPETLAIWAVYPTTRLVLPKVRVFIASLREALHGDKS